MTSKYKASFLVKSPSYSLLKIKDIFRPELDIHLQVFKKLVGDIPGFEDKAYLLIEDKNTNKVAEVLGFAKNCKDLDAQEILMGFVQNPEWLLITLRELTAEFKNKNSS